MPPAQKRRARGEHHDSPHARRQRSASQISSRSSGEDAEPTDLREFSSHDVMVKKVVRLALSSETSRKALRRQDIVDKALGPGEGRRFRLVFEDANKRLQDVFGMALVEQPQRDKVTVAEKRAAQRSGTTTATGAAGTNSWILTTVLPEKYRTHDIMPPPRLPSAEAEASYLGLVTFMVATIMLSTDQRISEGKLESYLRQANADEMFFDEKMEKVWKRMEKDGYIRKLKTNEGGEELIDYVVGGRGKVEIGAAGVAGMARTVFDTGNADMGRLEDRLERSLGVGTFKRRTRAGVNGETGNEEVDGESREEGAELNDSPAGQGARQSRNRQSRRQTRMTRTGREGNSDAEERQRNEQPEDDEEDD